MFGDSVVDVQHVSDPRGGKVTRATWAFVAGGAACLLASALAFGSAVRTSTRNDENLKHHVNVLEKPAYAFRPEAIGDGTGAVAFGGLALALAGLTAGIARSRRERQRPYYRIGTAPGVAHATESAPSADFALVAPRGDDFVFNFGAGMDGDVTVEGATTPLAALVAAGHARPSPAIAGAMELPIRANARIRARAGRSTFLVSATPKPAAQATPMLANLDSRIIKYAAGSLAVHLGVWALLQGVPLEDGGMAIDLGSTESIVTQTSMNERDDAVEEREPGDTGGTDGAPSAEGGSMTLPGGRAGRPSDQGEARMEIAKRSDEASMSRDEAIERATSAGTLGSTRAIEDAITSVTGQANWTSGFDQRNVWGGLQGGGGAQHGDFGFAPNGTGRGGDCKYGVCDGTVGSGKYKTIGDGRHAGSEYGGGDGTDGPLKNRTAKTPPPPKLGEPQCAGDGGCGLDKATIRRYIQRSSAKLQYCYEHALLANATLEGTVMTSFVIGADGSVMGARGTGVSPEVAACVAGVIANVSFPKPGGSGVIQVNYPIGFRFAK